MAGIAIRWRLKWRLDRRLVISVVLLLWTVLLK